MKKFVFLYCGMDEAPEARAIWADWFAGLGDSLVDSGNPLGPGRSVAAGGTADLAEGPDAVMGYSLIAAETLADAELVAASCPVVTAIRVYEALPM